jgi:hypothetical protein
MEDSHFDGLSSLVRLSGAHVPARARFVGEALLSASFSSITLGLVCGQAGAIMMGTTGPLIPFMVGSWFGYSFGLAAYWKASVKWCDNVALKYPTLLIHALKTNPYVVEVPPVEGNEDGKLVDWVKQGSLGRLSLCVLAAQACRNDVEEIERAERQRLMEEYQEQMKSNE